MNHLTENLDAKLERIIILSQNFPPVPRTSSYRAYAWAKYLSDYGFYPIIITCLNGTEKNNSIKYKEQYEVHFVACPAPFMKRLSKRLSTSSNRLLKFLGTLIKNLFENRFFYNHTYPLLNYAHHFLLNNNDISKIIATAKPFILFKFAFILKKKHNISWIADYRDDWSTSELFDKKSLGNFFARKFRKWDQGKERKWLASASLITSISPYYVEKICEFLGKSDGQSFVLENGYLEEDLEVAKNKTKILFEKFTITYVGAIYPSQDLNLLLDVLKILEKDYAGQIKLLFVGTKFSKTALKLIQPFRDTKFIEVIPRMSKKDCLAIQLKSHMLLMIAHERLKGVASSKLYEYIGLQKWVVLCPSDNDIIENNLKLTGQGIFINNLSDVNQIRVFIESHLEGNFIEPHVNEKEWKSFNRKVQTETLAAHLSFLK